MTNLAIIPKNNQLSGIAHQLSIALLFLGFLLGATTVRAAAIYSTGAPVVAAPGYTCIGLGPAQVCTGVAVTVGGAVNGLPLAASVYVPVAVGSNAVLRLRLSGPAPAGYRAGVLVSTTSSLVAANLLGAVTLRTYLSTAANAGTARDTRVVSGAVLQAQLRNGGGLPQQLELNSTQAFDEVEVEFAAALALGLTVDMRYAYGVSPNLGTQLTGYLSRFNPAITNLANQYTVSGTCANVTNAERTVDDDLTNYALFASLATVNCDGQLRVKLNGTAPASYRAGFVVGRANDLLDAGILTNLTLKTYYQGALAEQASAGASLLELSVLPDGRALVSFQATQPFDEVAIERTGLVTLLDNLQLYFGVGVAAASLSPLVYSNFASGAGHAQALNDGAACVGCGVLNADNAAGPSLNASATVQKTLGGLTSVGLRLELNGAGRAGNRAGVVLGENSLLDVSALPFVTLTTYNAANQVLESATGGDLLALAVLPNNRRRLSFNTTANFTKVSVTFGSALSALDTNNIFYAFADSTNGSFNIITPAAPLPVTLTSFGVRRTGGVGAAEVKWTTASEQNSAYFVVERTTDPLAGFQAIGRVAAGGNSSQPRHYRLLDANATPATTFYYRLRQVDEDGHATLSGVAVLAAGPAVAEFSLYPNPTSATTGHVTLRTGAALAAGSSISIYSATGQLLTSQPMPSGEDEANLELPTTNLATGLYHVVVRDVGGQPTASQRLVVE